jgi:hypothetical protein
MMKIFNDRYTAFPDEGIIELFCYDCNEKWAIGYHPSLDVLIERAAVHDKVKHA